MLRLWLPGTEWRTWVNFISMLFDQLCDALGYIHAQNMVHRDVKPGNIMVLPAESRSVIRVMLIDFGLARETEGGAASGAATATSAYTGSPAYMSPEQCEGKAVDFRSDIYALGCILHECLLGKAPFEGESLYDVLYKQIHSEPLLTDKKLTPQMKNLLKRALAKEPSERHGSASEFNDELQKALNQKNNPGRGALSGALPYASIMLILIVLSSIFLIWQHLSKNIEKASNSTSQDIAKEGIARKFGSGLLKPHMELEQIWIDADRTLNAEEMQEIIARIDELMPALKTPEERFIAYHIKADLLEHQGKSSQALPLYQAEYNEAVKRVKGGKFPLDAAKPLVMIASIKCKANKNEAEPIVREALKIYSQQEEGNYYRLELPFDYKCMDTNSVWSAAYSILAEIEYAQNKRKSAVQHATQAMKVLPEPFLITLFSTPFLRLADFLYEDKKKEAAVQTIDDVMDAIMNASERPSAEGELQNLYTGCLLSAKWFYDHLEYKRALAVKEKMEDLILRYPELRPKYEKDKDAQFIFFYSAEKIKANTN